MCCTLRTGASVARRVGGGTGRGRGVSRAAGLWVGAVCLAAACGCSSPPGPPLQQSSAHFRFSADAANSTRAEMAAGLERAEALYAAVAHIIGPAITPVQTLDVRLNGDFVGRGPFVDQEGVIQLFRYSEAEGGYWALLAHELVHAIAFEYGQSVHASQWPALGFYDEAWAEYVAQLVEPGKTGFPFYGFPEDVVVGHWVTSGHFVPMDQLRSRHVELNEPCQHQAYPQRASWIRHLDEVYGREKALRVIYPGQNPSHSYVAGVVGEPLEVLDAQWQAWIAARFAAIDDAQRQASAYRAATSDYAPCAF